MEKSKLILSTLNILFTAFVILFLGQILISKGVIKGSFFNEKSDFIIEELSAATSTSGDNQSISQYNVTSTWKLINTEEEGHYTIETYQEFDEYKDAHGKIVKTIPIITSPENSPRYTYLKYYNYDK